MPKPHSADGSEADHVGKVGWPLPGDRAQQVTPRACRHHEVEHEQCGCDSKHAIAERLHALCPHLPALPTLPSTPQGSRRLLIDVAHGIISSSTSLMA